MRPVPPRLVPTALGAAATLAGAACRPLPTPETSATLGVSASETGPGDTDTDGASDDGTVGPVMTTTADPSPTDSSAATTGEGSTSEASPSTTTDEASAHQRAGDAAMLGGRHDEAYFEYVEAYRLSPSPVLDFEARELLRAKIFLSLERLYASSRDVRHLCESWRFHALHVRELRDAGAREDRVVAVDAVTRQLAGRIAEVRGRPARRACSGDDSVRPRRIAGLSLLFGGMMALGAASGAAALYAGDLRYARDRREAYAGHSPTPIEESLDERLYERARLLRDITIAGSVIGGVFVVVGAVLLHSARARPAGRAVAVRPAFGPRAAGVSVRLSF